MPSSDKFDGPPVRALAAWRASAVRGNQAPHQTCQLLPRASALNGHHCCPAGGSRRASVSVSSAYRERASAPSAYACLTDGGSRRLHIEAGFRSGHGGPGSAHAGPVVASEDAPGLHRADSPESRLNWAAASREGAGPVIAPLFMQIERIFPDRPPELAADIVAGGMNPPSHSARSYQVRQWRQAGRRTPRPSPGRAVCCARTGPSFGAAGGKGLPLCADRVAISPALTSGGAGGRAGGAGGAMLAAQRPGQRFLALVACQAAGARCAGPQSSVRNNAETGPGRASARVTWPGTAESAGGERKREPEGVPRAEGPDGTDAATGCMRRFPRSRGHLPAT